MKEHGNSSLSKPIMWGVFVFFVVSLLSYIMPFLGFLLLLTGVGAPLAWAYFQLPTVSFVIALVTIVYWILPGTRVVRIAIAVLAVPLLMHVASRTLNFQLQAEAEALIKGDLNNIVLPLAHKSIAIRETVKFQPDAVRCGNFCIHALLSGSAERVLVPQTDRPGDVPDANEAAIVFSLEHQSTCTVQSFQHKPFDYNDIQSELSNDDGKNLAIDMMNLRLSRGECLIQRQATMREADLVISRTEPKSAEFPESFGVDLWAEAMTAHRTSVHKRDERDQGFEEVYRQTSINYLPFSPFLVPVVVFGEWISITVSWSRSEHRQVTGPVASHDWKTFLTSVLHLDVLLNHATTQQQSALDEN